MVITVQKRNVLTALVPSFLINLIKKKFSYYDYDFHFSIVSEILRDFLVAPEVAPHWWLHTVYGSAAAMAQHGVSMAKCYRTPCNPGVQVSKSARIQKLIN